MTATERAKRSDALYYETFSVTRRVLCDMIANREADLEDALAENDELLALNECMRLKDMAFMGELAEENERLKSDNAKLRELVRIAIEYCVNGYCAEEDECPLYESRHRCRLCAEARELGVDA